MNYYEHRLREIREQISLLKGHKGTEEIIYSLQQERNSILQKIEGEV